MYRNLKIAVVIPCYRVADQILDVLAKVPEVVDKIICIDDACPEKSGRLILESCADKRVTVHFHEENLGVGGAVKAGYLLARSAGCDIAVKIDGDGQMDPLLISNFLQPIASQLCDYTKGNRFFNIEDVRAMPRVRLWGNAALSFFAKLSTGYWSLFDPTNGYTALHLAVLDLISLDKVSNRYFFETDLLFRLNIARCVARDVPMEARYGNERSGLRVSHSLITFLRGHILNLSKRIFYSYFLRDFQVASLELLIGPPIFLTGLAFGVYHWWLSVTTEVPATAGTVMISALMILTGLQLTLSFLSFDMANAPHDPIHPLLKARKLPPSQS